MTSAVLQCVAVVTMLIDHLGYRIFPGVTALRMIGRLSFPIFAFLLAEGYHYTSNKRSYSRRLCIFAIISEIPYQLFAHRTLSPPYLSCENIMFELLLAFFALFAAERVLSGQMAWALGVGGAVVLAEVAGLMYGAYGIILAVAFYVFREKRWAGMVVLILATIVYCWIRGSLFQIWAIGAVIPLYVYNGKKGARLPRYFCYGFYPVHLLAIYGLYWLQQTI